MTNLDSLEIDELIQLLPDDEFVDLISELDLPIEEDATLIKRSDNTNVDPEKSRAAKQRYKDNKETYRKAFDKFRRSSRGLLFYKKLSRFNQRDSTQMSKESIDRFIDQVAAGTEAFKVLGEAMQEAIPPTEADDKQIDSFLKDSYWDKVTKQAYASKFGNRQRFRAHHGEFELDITPDKEGWSMGLYRPGKDAGNVPSSGEYKTWYPEDLNGVKAAIEDSKKVIQRADDFDKKHGIGKYKTN